MKFGGVCVFVDDVSAVVDFYRRAFGFETRFYDGAVFGDEANHYAVLEVDGASLGFGSHALGAAMMPGRYETPVNDRPSNVEIALTTDDVPAAFAKAIEAGAIALAEPKEMPWGGKISYVRSVEGTLIGIVTPVGE